MNNYMRTMIYLRKNENLEQSVGYLRLERKGGYLLFSLVLTGASMPSDCPIYAVYKGKDSQQCYCLGYTGEGKSQEGRILLSQLPERGLENTIYGALIGTKTSYLTGTAARHYELPQWQEEELVLAAAQEELQGLQPESKEEVLTELRQELAGAEKQTATTAQEIFEDDEMVWCQRINPTEVSNFDMEEWYLAANSFLLQGYYNYHHLIYASDGEKCYLGVPGQYQRRELYMAKRFGFPYFKSKRKKVLRMGDFGYWLREIKKDVKK